MGKPTDNGDYLLPEAIDLFQKAKAAGTYLPIVIYFEMPLKIDRRTPVTAGTNE